MRSRRTTRRRRVLILVVLATLLALDYRVVVWNGNYDEPLTRESLPLLGPHHRRKMDMVPDVQIAPEAIPPRLLYGTEATRARERGEQIWAASITWPFPRQWGILTPFYRWAEFRFQGWDEETDALRDDFVAHVEADPAFAELPKWSRAAMTSETGRAHRIVWGLLLHDVLFLAAILVFAWTLLATIVDGVRMLRSRLRPGCCRRCGYNLAGLAGGVCPECGEKTTATLGAGSRS